MNKLYDVAVVGGGPAGYTGALYCARAGFSVLVVERLGPGGQLSTTTEVDNYPGFDRGVDGFDLAQRMQRGAERFGAETLLAQVQSVQLEGQPKRLHTSRGTINARTVILATGALPRQLGLQDEDRLRGRGVSYCAVCDGMFYRDKTVVVAGGGDSAVADALFLSKLCSRVVLVHRRDRLRASRFYLNRLEDSGVEFRWNTRVTRLLGGERLEGVALTDTVSGRTETLACEGLFVAIGRIPDTLLFRDQVALDPQGYLVADESTRTSLPGVFAAGDARQKPLRQIVTAASDGAVASLFAEEYLLQLEALLS